MKNVTRPFFKYDRSAHAPGLGDRNAAGVFHDGRSWGTASALGTVRRRDDVSRSGRNHPRTAGESFRRRARASAAAIGICLLMVCWTSPGRAAQQVLQALSLNEAYQLAWDRQASIMIARREVEKSKLLPKRALATYLPNLSAATGYQVMEDDIEYQRRTIVPEDTFSARFSASQPIYNADFFPLWKQAHLILDAQTANLLQTTQDVLFTVARAYYTVLKEERLVDNAEQMLNLAREERDTSQARFKAGSVTEDALIRSELHVTEAQGILIQTRNNLVLAEHTLKKSIGLSVSELGDLAVSEPWQPSPLREPFAALFDMAMENRNDYQASSLQVYVAEQEVYRAQARFHPKLLAEWKYYWYSDPAFNQDDNYWVGSVTLNIPLFEGGDRIWVLREKQQSLHQARLALAETKKGIEVEVQNARLNVDNQQSLVANAQKQVELALKSHDLTFSRFKAGSATDFDLSQVRSQLFAANTSLANRNFDYQMAAVELERSTGVFASDFTSGKIRSPEIPEESLSWPYTQRDTAREP